MKFLQQNIYSWETMVSSAVYQLSEGNSAPPYAMVFEPPGRFGTRRVLPELNMVYDCQIPVNNPANLAGIITGFLRGAARITGKEWGISIYGQVDRSDTFWFLTHAYDQGAALFFYWDTYQLAAVPYSEYLAMSRHLRAHARSHPRSDMNKLKNAAETAILIPPGYNLGHVKMGIGNISGLPEMNMERYNSCGVKYRQIMSNFFVEIERCIRLGIEYDLFWNMQNLELWDYREVVTVREDGRIELNTNGTTVMLDQPRIPERPGGIAPVITLDLELLGRSAPCEVNARAEITEGPSPVYYTRGADENGIHSNQYVLWELFGPEPEDYSDFWNERFNISITEENNRIVVEKHFMMNRPGAYRLRAAVSDLAGRSGVAWKNIKIVDNR
jgi:hypothetical protein